jgi:hypothetical protein
LDTFLNFWDQHDTAINADNCNYIWQAYFNIAHSFPDKFIAAQHAISLLIMKENEFQPVRLVLNHFIFYKADNHVEDAQIVGNIKVQVDLKSNELLHAFRAHMRKMTANYFHMATNGRNDFVTKVFIYSFARLFQEEYITQLKSHDYLSNPLFALFYLNLFFVIRNEAGNVINFDLSQKTLLLGDDTWQTFFETLQKGKPGTWNEKDTITVKKFLESMGNKK